MTTARTIFIFFFNDTATTEIYTLSLHDALPISRNVSGGGRFGVATGNFVDWRGQQHSFDGIALFYFHGDRERTRLKFSHLVILYAVFFFEKKKRTQAHRSMPSDLPKHRIPPSLP